MNAKNSLRALTVLLAFSSMVFAASATDEPKGEPQATGKQADAKDVSKQTRPLAGTSRKMSTAFVDPTLPLAEWVERERTERTRK